MGPSGLARRGRGVPVGRRGNGLRRATGDDIALRRFRLRRAPGLAVSEGPNGRCETRDPSGLSDRVRGPAGSARAPFACSARVGGTGIGCLQRREIGEVWRACQPYGGSPPGSSLKWAPLVEWRRGADSAFVRRGGGQVRMRCYPLRPDIFVKHLELAGAVACPQRRAPMDVRGSWVIESCLSRLQAPLNAAEYSGNTARLCGLSLMDARGGLPRAAVIGAEMLVRG